MPHINRIRVNNVKYNFGTQFYDDFVMRFDGRNALYDLANGGGKSVLMLLLFQNLIPNCTLDDKQPIEKLFRTGEGSTTIHSLVEWKLDAGEAYKYMLTGFCARKAKEDDSREKKRDVAAIDYFNYVIFYREYNDNDIINLPLCHGKERITYTGLKSYLKALGHGDLSLDVHIFERKGEYQRFISQYGLYESAWEIIRGINKTEGHVRTWFETNFRTTRKVVEDLLIEEIIQKAFHTKAQGQGDADMAKTLMEIKDQLLKLSKKKEEISGYEHQIEALENFSGRIETLEKLYDEEQTFYFELVKAYNTASNAMRQKEKELALSEKEAALYSGRAQEITRKLESAKISRTQEQLKACEADTGKYDQELADLRAKRGEQQLELSMKLCANDYLAYMEDKKKAAAVRHAIDHADTGSDELLVKLNGYAARQKKFFEHNEKLWCQELEQLKAELSQAEALAGRSARKQSELERELAVTGSKLEHSRQEETRLLEEIHRLSKNVNALLVEEPEREIRHRQIESRNVSGEIARMEEEQSQAREKIHANAVRREAIRVTVETMEKEAREFAEFEKTWQQKKAKADKLMEVYHSPDYRTLKNTIYERWQKVVVDAYEKHSALRRCRELCNQLDSFQPMLSDKARTELMDYLRRCHGVTCMAGCDYISGLPKEQRRELLERIPWLPCAIIVRDGFSQVAGDHVLLEKELGENIYPIIGLDRVLGSEAALKEEHVLFLTKNKKLFYDESAVQARKAALKEEQEQLERALSRLEDTSRTYRSDVEYLSEFIVDYHDKYVDKLAEMTRSRGQIDALKNENLALENENIRLKAELSERDSVISEQKARLEEIAEELKTLEMIDGLNSTLKTTEDQTRQYREQERSLKVTLEQAKLSCQEAEKKAQESRSRMEFLAESRKAQDKVWQEIYSGYYKEPDSASGPEAVESKGEVSEAGTDSAASGAEAAESESKASEAGMDSAASGPEAAAAEDMDSDAIDGIFRGLKEAFEKEHMDIEDKRQLLESYEQSMRRLLALIEERGVSVKELEELYDKGLLMPAAQETIDSLKESIARRRDELQEIGRRAEQVRADQNRLAGRVENAISAVKEKYGSFEAVELKDGSYELFMEELEGALKTAKERMEQSGENGRRLSRELRGIEDTRKDLERLMRTARVTYNLTRDFYADSRGLRKRYEDLSEQYEHLRNEEHQKREAFEKNKDQLANIMFEQKAIPLADEIRYHMEIPGDAREAQALAARIRETVQIIRLEKERISQGIEDMIQIKESFENQCLQRCLDIKTQLERLPGLSKIMLDGVWVPMLQLKIPYVREEFYRQRMSEYIDSVVVNSDTYKAFDDKLKYIRQKLAWKNLFSVIVTDMNSIRLNLYKRERIHEQSRYLKYEEAVGSTGQSQGIYIQFLIAVINYISALYAPEGDSTAAGKVIFIDNPFGAAKDIYIWEPIFKLLKANNVQMIVPARGATPAISGMFDVNYILGQKMIDGKIQTVVVDYYSNVDIDDMEYVKIDFEQEVFDFI